MRAIVVGAAALGLVAALAGCVQPYAPPQLEIAMARVDPEDAADRALIGSVVGAALGTGLGTTFAINPAIGAVIGVESGAAIGAAIGAVTAHGSSARCRPAAGNARWRCRRRAKGTRR